MRGKTIFASIVTLTFLVTFIFITMMAASFSALADNNDLGVPVVMALSIGLTIVWSALVWLISPWIMDAIQSWVYDARNITIEELGQQRPAVAQFVWNVCQKHKIKVPRLKYIDDMTPQAYCYGSYANNSRLVVTRGLIHYLDDEELKAVYAHELGHIIHRDFIVMTIAATLLNILWNIYVIAKNIRGRNNSRPGYPIALVALVFWWISQYILLWLSRTREYYADEFAGQETGNPNALSMALVKIAYGITQAPSTKVSQKLIGGTRALGVSDFKASSGPGIAFGAAQRQSQQQQGYAQAQGYAYGGQQAAYAGAYGGQQQGYGGYGQAAAPAASATYEAIRRIEKVFLFDLYNPWATVSEIASTHPLTGKRIRAMGQQAQAMGQQALFSFEKIDAQGQALDMTKMYGNFFFEVAVYYMPHILGTLFALGAIGAGIAGEGTIAGILAGAIVFGIGLGMTIKGFYRFRPLGTPQPATVLELMSDPYASPLRGRPVALQGTIVGRADAGNQIGEDMTLEDPHGGIMTLNYESPFGKLGNWWFAIRTVNKLVNQPVQVIGWFRRSTYQLVDLKAMRTMGGEEIRSWTGFWGKIGGVLVLILGIIIAAVAAAAAAGV